MPGRQPTNDRASLCQCVCSCALHVSHYLCMSSEALPLRVIFFATALPCQVVQSITEVISQAPTNLAWQLIGGSTQTGRRTQAAVHSGDYQQPMQPRVLPHLPPVSSATGHVSGSGCVDASGAQVQSNRHSMRSDSEGSHRSVQPKMPPVFISAPETLQ